MKLWKTIITIWSEFDPQQVELEDLAREAVVGSAYCSRCFSAFVETKTDPDWDGTEFFDNGDLENDIT